MKKPIAYICTPYRRDRQRGLEIARDLVRRALKDGKLPISAPLILHGVLDDEVPAERELSLSICDQLVELADEVHVAIDYNDLSEGQLREIAAAKRLGIAVVYTAASEAMAIPSSREGA